MIDEIKVDMGVHMDKAVDSLKNQLTRIRTGRASASALNGIMVDYYGVPTPLTQVGQVSTPEARLLQIQPFDKNLIAAIERAIHVANIGVNPSNDGNLIRIPFPALTEEKRKEQVKEIKRLGEDAKVAIRNCRRDQNEVVKLAEKEKGISEDDLKKFQGEIQTVTDEFVKNVDTIIGSKENELMTI